ITYNPPTAPPKTGLLRSNQSASPPSCLPPSAKIKKKITAKHKTTRDAPPDCPNPKKKLHLAHTCRTPYRAPMYPYQRPPMPAPQPHRLLIVDDDPSIH